MQLCLIITVAHTVCEIGLYPCGIVFGKKIPVLSSYVGIDIIMFVYNKTTQVKILVIRLLCDSTLL